MPGITTSRTEDDVELPSMALLTRWIGRDRSEADALRAQVTALQTKLGQCKAAVRRWSGVRRGFEPLCRVPDSSPPLA